MAKGIRVSQLAKELGVESKAILSKLKDEGLSDKASNHMSLLPLGLAESVREWFSDGGGGTAVETAARVEVSTKTTRARRTRKKTDAENASSDADGGSAGDDDAHGSSDADGTPENTEESTQAVAAAPEAEVEQAADSKVHAPVAVVDEPAAAIAEAPVDAALEAVAPASVIEEQAPVVPAAEALVVPAVEAPVEPVAPVAPEPDQPVVPAVAATARPAAPEHPHGGHSRSGAARPTITLANRGADRPAERVAERPPVTQAARLLAPAPAKIQGPRVVREEKPDIVPTPRSRRAPGTGPNTEPPAFNQARPQAGRGVRSAENEEEETEAQANQRKAADKKGNKSLSSRRRGPDGRRGEAMEKLKEYTEADLIERRDRLNAAAGYRAGVNSHLKQRDRHSNSPAKTIVQRGDPVVVEEPVTVRTLAAALGIKASDIISALMKNGTFATINQALNRDAADVIALEYGIELQWVEKVTNEQQLKDEFEAFITKAEHNQTRPPVVTILGHVDHGKTSLLDRIRKANVAAGEAGGITQHTAAWMVQLGEKRVTFIDTPGHQAFTSMRARGANMTDVVVLVVSAAEGVQPQTVESINHAKAAGVPIVVAMNKIDRPDANDQQVLGQLAAQGLNPVEWGGDTEVIRTSATTGQGVEELIEILDYQSQLLDLKADPTLPATGMVIESNVDLGLGTVATVLVQNGTLKVGDALLCGTAYGRIRSLLDDRGKMIKEAGPSTPVVVSGLDTLPNAGDRFYVVGDVERARMLAAERTEARRSMTLANKSQVTLDNIFATMKADDIKTINLIIKGDVQGSVETLAKSVTGSNTDEVRVRVIHAAVGAISESDVELADASGAVIIGFHVVPDESARAMAEQRRVEIRLYRVIYEIFDDLKKALSGLLEPEIREKLHGHLEVRQVIKVSRIGNIAGCMVTDGHVQRGSKIRLIRNGAVITADLSLESLRRIKDDVREVKAGLECGVKLAGYDDVKIGDTLEAYIRETIERTL